MTNEMTDAEIARKAQISVLARQLLAGRKDVSPEERAEVLEALDGLFPPVAEPAAPVVVIPPPDPRQRGIQITTYSTGERAGEVEYEVVWDGELVAFHGTREEADADLAERWDAESGGAP